MSGLVCAGNVLINPYINGVLTGFVGPINATKFSLSPGQADKLDRVSYQRDTFGNALDSVVFPGVSSLSIDTDDAAAEILQFSMLATLSDVALSQGQVLVGAPESITAHLDRWTRLANRNVASVVIKDSTNVTTYVNGTDYTLDATSGLVKALASGSINDGDTLHVSYNYGALSGKQLIAATQTEVRAYVLLDGKNLANQKKVEIVVPEAVLVPSGELDVAGKKFVTFSLSGSVVTRSGELGPYTYRELTETAYA